MKYLSQFTKQISLAFFVLFFMAVSAQSNLALGSFKVAQQQNPIISGSPRVAGEPVAVAVALGVLAVSVVASGFAFALGVYDGVSGRRGEYAIHNSSDFQLKTDNPSEFSQFDSI